MSSSESERVQEILQDKAQGDEKGETLAFDPLSKTIRVVGGKDPDDGTLSVEPSDMKQFLDQGSSDDDHN